MTNSRLEKVPAAICQIETLHLFTFNSSSLKEDGFSIFEDCGNKTTSLYSLTLDGNNTAEFPSNVFKLFPNLTYLSLRNNNIRFIHDSAIYYNTTLVSLDLSENRFLRIPAAVNQFLNLEVLYFESNHVVSLEDFDVFKRSKLRKLYIENTR